MSVEQTLQERGSRYGDFSDHAKIAQDLQEAMRAPIGWQKLDDVKRQALTVIADKIARILNGDPNYTDNWHDIQGYAKLAEDRCRDTPTQAGTEDHQQSEAGLRHRGRFGPLHETLVGDSEEPPVQHLSARYPEI